MEFKKGDLLIYYHNFYFPIIVMHDGLHKKNNTTSYIIGGVPVNLGNTKTIGVSARTLLMIQD